MRRKTTMTQNLWDTAKAVPRSFEIRNNISLPEETRKTSNKQSNLTPERTRKRTSKAQSEQEEGNNKDQSRSK